MSEIHTSQEEIQRWCGEELLFMGNKEVQGRLNCLHWCELQCLMAEGEAYFKERIFNSIIKILSSKPELFLLLYKQKLNSTKSSLLLKTADDTMNLKGHVEFGVFSSSAGADFTGEIPSLRPVGWYRRRKLGVGNKSVS